MNASFIIAMDNAAFDQPATELASILRTLADKVEKTENLMEKDVFTARDSNGNKVGELEIHDHAVIAVRSEYGR